MPLARAWRWLLMLGIALVVAKTPVWGGGGPCGYLVVYDPTDTNSIAVANYYQQVRHVPEANMVPYVFPNTGFSDRRIMSTDGSWAFISTLTSIVNQRGMTGHFNGIAMAGISPVCAGVSMHSILFASPNYASTNYLSLPGFYNGAFRPNGATTELRSDLVLTNTRSPYWSSGSYSGQYWAVSYVGYTGAGGNSPQDVFNLLQRSKAADGHGQGGTIYCPYSGDSVRYRIRGGTWSGVGSVVGEIAKDAIPVWNSNGIAYVQSAQPDAFWIQNGSMTNVSDNAGEIVGYSQVEWGNNNNTYLPGAFADHATSYAGQIDWWQTGNQGTCAQEIHKGLYGSAGTINEPYALAAKFPHPNLHTHFRNGASLAEAAWESIQYAAEIVFVGDPLLQPYATFPTVAVTSPAADGTTVSSNLVISANATVGAVTSPTTMIPTGVESNLDVAVDGHVVNIGQGGETIAVTRTNGGTGFILDTTTLADGWHELRVIAYNRNAVRTQGEATRTIFVNNHGQSVALSGPASVDYAGGTAGFTATPAGPGTVTNLTLQVNGRTLASLPVSGGTTNLPAAMFGYQGTTTVYAVSWLNNGQQVWSAPWSLNVAWTPNAPASVTLTSNRTATVKYFANTQTNTFSWANPPTATTTLTNNLIFNTNNLAAVLPTDYSTLPGYQVDTYYWAATTNLYEFALGDANNAYTHTLGNITMLVDGQPVGIIAGTTVPVRLATGAHTLTMRFAVLTNSFFGRVYVRDIAEQQVGGSTVSQLYAIVPQTCLFTATNATPPAITAGTASRLSTNQVSLSVTATTGNPGPLTYTWTKADGPVEGVVAFAQNGTAAAFTNTATFGMAGTYLLQVAVNDGTAVTFDQFSVKVTTNQPPSISSALSATGLVNLAFSYTITASNSPTRFDAVGLPSGLSVNTNNGVIAGIPVAAGTNNVTISATSDDGTDSKTLVLIINPAVTISTTSPLSTGTVAYAYSQTLAATGGVTPYTWGIVSGSLPAGLGFVTATGAITGTPTTVGTANFNVRVADSVGGSATNAFSLTVVPTPPPSITTTSPLPNGTVGWAYNQTLVVAGGIAPYTWGIISGSLPAGLGLVTATGAITGTPTTVGTANFNVRVADSVGGSATNAFSLTVVPTPPLMITTTSPLPDGAPNASYNLTLAATGGITPYTWGIASGSLPAGLGLVPGTGAITGTPTTVGSTAFNIMVTDNVGTVATNAFNLTINLLEFYWTNTQARADFTNQFNVWQPALPGPSDEVNFTNNLTYTANFTNNVQVQNLSAYFNATSGTVTQQFASGAVWTVAHSYVLSQNPGAAATVVLAGAGTVAVTNGGTAQLLVGQSGRGTLTLNGGNLIVDQLFMTNNTTTTTNSFLTSTSSANVTINNGSTFYVNSNTKLNINGTWLMAGGQNTVSNMVTGATPFYIGGTLAVTGANTVLSYIGPLDNSSTPGAGVGGLLVVSNQARAFFTGGGGNFAIAPNATVTVNNASMTFSNEIVKVGFNTGNGLPDSRGTLIVTNQGYLIAVSGIDLGGNNNATVSGNLLLIAGGGVVSNYGALRVAGQNANLEGLNYGNHVDITSGGQMINTNTGNTIGYVNFSTATIRSNNYLWVSGQTSTGLFYRDLTVGSDGYNFGQKGTSIGNYLQLDNGGTLIASNLSVSAGLITSNNYILVNGGNLYVTNALGNGRLMIGDPGNGSTVDGAGTGWLVISNGGLVTVDKLIVTNTLSTVTFTGGTLALNKSIYLGNAITAGGTVKGNGYITGITNITGALSPGFSVGALTFSNDLTFGSSAVARYDLGTNQDLTVVTGTLNLGGTLVVTDAGGLTTGTYTLVSYGALGSLTMTNDNPLPGGLSGVISNDAANNRVVLVVTSGAPPPPAANFTAAPLSGVEPLTVVFTDVSTGGTPTSWVWDFGNGTASASHPTNTYWAGTYPVSLTVSNAGGSSTTNKLNYITVITAAQSWQNYYGVAPDSADPLGKGISNTNQFLAGFDPTHPAAYPHIISLAVVAGTNMDITYLGANGDTSYVGGPISRTNVLEISVGGANGSYTNAFVSAGVTNILTGGTGLGVITNMLDVGGATNKPSRFYRVRVVTP
ncbi:MAG: putative Ig domain-containing protein [Verrucomicrobiota bacterium]